MYMNEPLSDPFILKIFLSNKPKPDDIAFSIINTTKHSLKTKIQITPIIFNSRYSIQEQEIVLNPNEVYQKNITSDYGNVRNINSMHDLTSNDYKNERQPVKFHLKARYHNSRIKVLKFKNCIQNISVYEPSDKSFRRVK